MTKFKAGDKVRNKVTEEVLTCTFVGANCVHVKTHGYAQNCDGETFSWKDVVVRWSIEDCEPYRGNQPVSVSVRPADYDVDKFGHILCFFNKKHWKSMTLDVARKSMESGETTRWRRTDDWKPREPLCVSCNGCENYGHNEEGKWAYVCWKFKRFNPEPFYTDNGTPCHLVQKEKPDHHD